MIPGIALDQLTPENLEKIKGLIDDAKPEFEKFVSKVLEMSGLTRDSDYSGLVPIAILAYDYIWPVVKEIVSILHMTYADLIALYNFLGGIEGDIMSIPKSIENFFKHL